MKEVIDLLVKPEGYDDPNFDKFAYYKAIGSWPMAKQLYEQTKEQLETANFYRDQNAEYIQRLEEENARLRDMVKEEINKGDKYELKAWGEYKKD